MRHRNPRQAFSSAGRASVLVAAALAALPAAAAAAPVLTLDGHDPDSYCVAFSPDGKTVATGGADNMVRLWDFKTGKEKFALEAAPPRPADEKGLTAREKGPPHGTTAVAFTPDGKTLLAYCYWHTGKPDELTHDQNYGQNYDGGVRVWDLEPRKLRYTLKGGPHIAVAPDGKTVATTGGGPKGCDIVLWDLATGKQAGLLGDHKTPPGPIAFFPDGKRLAVAPRNSPIELWDVAARKLLATVPPGGWDMAIAPDGKTLAAFDGERVNLYEVEDPDNIRLRDSSVRLDGDSSTRNVLHYSPDGKILVFRNKVLSPWSAAGQRYILIGSQRGYSGAGVGMIAFSPDGKLLAVVSGCVGFYRVDDE